MYRFRLLPLLFIVLLSANITAQTTQSPAPPVFKARPIEIPFELVSKHIFLKIKVDNSRPLAFIFDTGDQVAIIDIDRARELNLTLNGELKVGGAGPNLLTGAYVKDSSFSIPGLDGFTQPVRIALPLRAMAAQLGQDFDGIIGAEFIKQFVVEIDYEASVIRLHDKDKFAYSGSGESVPVALNNGGHPVIEAEVTPEGEGPVKGKFVLDLGSGGALALTSPFVSAHHLPGPNTRTINTLGGGGAGGDVTGQIGRVGALKIGSFTLNKPITLFSADKSGALAGADLIGNIGYHIASRFRIFLDYTHQRIIFEPTSKLAAPFDRASAGLRIVCEGEDYKTFRIKNILEDSPASEAGLQKDDIIVAIGDLPAARLTLSKIIQLFERPTNYKVKVQRGDQTLQVTLTPRSLL